MISNSKLLPQDIIDDAINHAFECLPYESIGYVVDNKYIASNSAISSPIAAFLDTPSFYQAYSANKITAIIHSHIDTPAFSKQDMIMQQEFDIPLGLINIVDNDVTHFMLLDDSKQPLIGRPWFPGLCDCFTLVRDFYRDKYLFDNFPRSFTELEGIFEKEICSGKHPFIEVPTTEASSGDIILYCFGSHINHIAILYDTSHVLHHLIDKLSGLYPVGLFRNKIHSVWRFNNI